jgi:hypothetical protein
VPEQYPPEAHGDATRGPIRLLTLLPGGRPSLARSDRRQKGLVVAQSSRGHDLASGNPSAQGKAQGDLNLIPQEVVPRRFDEAVNGG